MAAHRWSLIESELRRLHGDATLIAGVDEVGRGPLAGPVVACAVIMPAGRRAIGGVNDSKCLSPADRERLAIRIRRHALAVSVAAASVREIDTRNIYHATTLAMRRAITRLRVTPHHVLIDGKPIRELGIPHTAVIDGDARCYHIACASIVAKVLRDALMCRLSRRYPVYGWDQNAGYGTPAHIACLESAGATPHHRTTFRVRQLEMDLTFVAADRAGPADERAADQLATDRVAGGASDAPPLTTELGADQR